MPNWCYNKLSVAGDEEDLLEFKECVKSKEEGIDTDIRMNNLIPMPEELVDTISPHEHPNWYDWALTNWGCKWDLNAVLVEETKCRLIYRFDSPWAPPIRFIYNIAPLFPDLLFQLIYREGGMCFRGTMSAQNYLLLHSEEKYYEDFRNMDEKDDYEKFREKGKIRRYDISGNDISDDIVKCEYCGNEVNLKDREYGLRQSSEGMIIVDKLYSDIAQSEEEGCIYNIPYLKSERFVTTFINCCEYPYYTPFAARMNGVEFNRNRDQMKEDAIKYYKHQEDKKKNKRKLEEELAETVIIKDDN